MPSSVPGGRAPHFWVDDGRGQGSSVYDHFGIGFTLLAFKEIDGGAQPEIAREAARRDIPFTVYRVSNEAARRMYGVDYALVRPDQHIAWSGDSLPPASGALWDKVTGRLM
jgi:hypothetical protein